MNSKLTAKKYFKKYFKSSFITENDKEFKALVRLLNKAQKSTNLEQKKPKTEQKTGNMEQKSLYETILGFGNEIFQLSHESKETVFLKKGNFNNHDGYHVTCKIDVWNSFVSRFNIFDFVEEHLSEGYTCSLYVDNPEQKPGNLVEQTSVVQIVERYGVHHFELLDNKNNTIAEFEKMDNGNYRIRYCRSEKELYQSLGSVINIIREEMKNGCSLQRINGRL